MANIMVEHGSRGQRPQETTQAGPTGESLSKKVFGGIRGLRDGRVNSRLAAQAHAAARENVFASASTEDIVVHEKSGHHSINPHVDPESLSPERAQAREFLSGMTSKELAQYRAGIERAVAEDQFAASMHVLDHATATDVAFTQEGGVIVNPRNLTSKQVTPERQTALEILASMPDEERSQFGRALGNPEAREALRETVWNNYPYHDHHEDDPGY